MARAKAEKRAAKHALSRVKKLSRKKSGKKVVKLKLVLPVSDAKMSAKAKTTAAKQLAEESGEKKLSSKLLETLERHRQKRAAEFAASKPKGRRGRRPKVSLDYVPEHQEEDGYVLEQEFETLQYDTGIAVPSKADESGLALDRAEDFDEELNFDW